MNSTVAQTYYAIDDYDRVLAQRLLAGTMKVPDFRVRVKRVKVAKGTWPARAALITAKIAGVAIVLDRETRVATVIGSHVGLAAWRWPYRPYKAAVAEALECLDLPGTSWLPAVQVAAQRRNDLMVRHKVVELFPTLRRWQDLSPGQEVSLYAVADQLVPGGALWSVDYYRAGEYVRALRKRKGEHRAQVE